MTATPEIETVPKDGGPAFPMPGVPSNWSATKQDGLTLRDYFAAASLGALGLSHTLGLEKSWSDNPQYLKDVAASAYACADAMLQARKVAK